MKRITPGILILIFSALSLFALGCPDDCPETIVIDDPSVGVTGDSILSGRGCACGGTAPYLNHALLDMGIEDCQVVNFAVFGTTMAWGIPLQYDNLKSTYPDADIVLVNGGVNDVYYAEKNGSLDEHRIQMIEQAMLDYLAVIDNDGKTGVLYTIPYLNAPPPDMTPDNMANMNDAIHELNTEYALQAAGFGFPVFALEAMMEENPEDYYTDWIHPTCTAYEEMTERMALIIQGLDAGLKRDRGIPTD